MKKLFYALILLFIAFEFTTLYLIRQFPGSQDLNLLAFSHALHRYKFLIEIVLLIVITITFIKMFRNGQRTGPVIFIVLAMASYISFGFLMTPEYQFRQPSMVVALNSAENEIPMEEPVIGLVVDGFPRAYPIRLVKYHHQVRDEINGQKLMITYCQLCRSGRVYKPFVLGKEENFSLVGVNHYNATFKDSQTQSWWSQETGTCIAGALKGEQLEEIYSNQMKLTKWLELYPNSTIMQRDPKLLKRYRFANKRRGDKKESSEETDLPDWSEQSVIVGVDLGSATKAYPWEKLVESPLLLDSIDRTAVMLVLSNDKHSFIAFKSPASKNIRVENDTVYVNGTSFDFAGHCIDHSLPDLEPVNAYRESWFSWEFSHPGTLKYEMPNNHD